MKTPRFILRYLSAAILSGSLALSTGCLTHYSTPVKPPTGALFYSIKAPLTVEFDNTPCGPSVKKYAHSNTAYFREFLFTRIDFAWDDVAIANLAREGGIEEISYADYEALNILGIYSKFTVNVYGN